LSRYFHGGVCECVCICSTRTTFFFFRVEEEDEYKYNAFFFNVVRVSGYYYSYYYYSYYEILLYRSFLVFLKKHTLVLHLIVPHISSLVVERRVYIGFCVYVCVRKRVMFSCFALQYREGKTETYRQANSEEIPKLFEPNTQHSTYL